MLAQRSTPGYTVPPPAGDSEDEPEPVALRESDPTALVTGKVGTDPGVTETTGDLEEGVGTR